MDHAPKQRPNLEGINAAGPGIETRRQQTSRAQSQAAKQPGNQRLF